jgi:hypothetical protein
MGTNIQNVGHFAWKDSYKWMEPMKGEAWQRIIQRHKKIFQEAVTPQVLADAQQIEQEFASELSFLKPSTVESIVFERDGTFHYQWQLDGGGIHGCADFSVEGKQIWQVADSSEGSEKYTVSHFKNGKKIWSHRQGLAPCIAVLDGRCYVIEAENNLWFCRLISYDAATGSDRQVIFEMKNPQWNMTLIKGSNKCLFLSANNAGQQRLWHVYNNTIKELRTGYTAFVPIGYLPGLKEPHYFARKETSYVPVGSAFTSLQFPSLQQHTPESCFLEYKILITRSYGKRTIWDLQTGRAIQDLVGNLEADPISAWHGKGAESLVLVRPGYEACGFWDTQLRTLCPYAPYQEYGFAKSRDGKKVPFVVVSQCARPCALLVVGYGGYGIPTSMSTSRWKPLLKRGFAVALAMVRGGGDHTDAWAEAARRDQKIKSIEDLEGVIRRLQSLLRVPASSTALYGRSAGGYLMGAMPPRHPRGDLFGAVYVEVPYLDVFSTTANPGLPLTQMEYNEFGDPLHRLNDARAILRLSPIDALKKGGAPGVWVLSRTGHNDKEVFSYESVKWITKLQDLQEKNPDAASKILAFTEAEGHFVTGPTAQKERALDLSLLLSWHATHKKSNTRIYNMLSTRRNRRNNTMMRKNRKNNNVTLGGKRRRNNMTARKNRKNRKNTRRNY